jgi:hypothetical protein
MGTCYYFVCTKCKEALDLDKFYFIHASPENVGTKEYLIRLDEEKSRVGKIISFVGRHCGHPLIMLNDSSHDVHDPEATHNIVGYKEIDGFIEC